MCREVENMFRFKVVGRHFLLHLPPKVSVKKKLNPNIEASVNLF